MERFKNRPYDNTSHWANIKIPESTKSNRLRESFKIVSTEYCAESSICGLKYLVDERCSVIERIVWAVIVATGLACSILLVRITFDKYYTAPLVTTQMPEGVSVSEIIFPAVGICSNNRISRRAVTQLAKKLVKEEWNAKFTEEQILMHLQDLGRLYDYRPTNDPKGFNSALHKILGDYKITDLMRNITPPCSDLLLKCSWNTQPSNCLSLFDFRLTMNGYCCTFNYLRVYDSKFIEKDRNNMSMDMYEFGNKSHFDFDQGLKVLLRLNESDDFYYNMPLQGAQLQFSDAYDFPDSPSGSFAMQIISPAVQMLVTLSASLTQASRDIQHVPVKLRGCQFYDESTYLSFYTYSDCILKCRMSFLFDKCNCTPFNMPKKMGIQTCRVKDVPCLGKYYGNIGSTCGFVTGLSFVSVLEFIYFFTIRLIREIHTRKGKKIDKVHPSQYEPIKRYRPLYWNELTGAAKYAQNYGSGHSFRPKNSLGTITTTY